MSRRTKLLITALFLVLLAIPVVYLFLTWSPANPLRFRAVVAESNTSPVGWRNLEIFVENTSLAPVHLIEFTQGPAYEYAEPVRLTPAPTGPFASPAIATPGVYPGSRTVPPRGELRLWYVIKESQLQKEDGQYWMQYACLTGTKARGIRFFSWLHDHGPRWLHPYLPEFPLYYYSSPLSTPSMNMSK